MAEALGATPKTLYRYGKIAETWSYEQMEQLLQRKSELGTLTKSHFYLLTDAYSGVSLTDDQRRQLIEWTLAYSLKPCQLKTAILELLEQTPPGGFSKLARRADRQTDDVQSLTSAIIQHVPYMRLTHHTPAEKQEIADVRDKLKDAQLRIAATVEKLETMLTSDE